MLATRWELNTSVLVCLHAMLCFAGVGGVRRGVRALRKQMSGLLSCGAQSL